MIIVEIKLVSAISSDRDANLGTLVIDNITTREKFREHDGRRCDYRCRMYRRGALTKAKGEPAVMVGKNAHTRETVVLDHARHAEPVQNLVAKALEGMGYGSGSRVPRGASRSHVS